MHGLVSDLSVHCRKPDVWKFVFEPLRECICAAEGVELHMTEHKYALSLEHVDNVGRLKFPYGCIEVRADSDHNDLGIRVLRGVCEQTNFMMTTPLCKYFIRWISEHYSNRGFQTSNAYFFYTSVVYTETKMKLIIVCRVGR